MSELGETVAIALEAIKELAECPFCESDEGKEEEYDDPDESEDIKKADDYRVRNDSSQLAGNLESHPRLEMVDPWAFKKPVPETVYKKGMQDLALPDKYESHIFIYEIKADEWGDNKKGSWVDEDHSLVRCNAHHLIPGNAALWQSKELLKFFAKKVHRKVTITYDKDKAVPSKADVEASSETTYGPDVKASVKRGRTKKGKMKDDVDLTVVPGPAAPNLPPVTGKVTGKIDWKLNGNKNGIWLPSNNAVGNWKQTTDVDKKFGDRYATEAVRATSSKKYLQFHDSHAGYSNEVKKILARLAQELDDRANNCLNGQCSGKRSGKKSEPLPAPRTLTNALNKISEKLEEKLKGQPKKWKKPFITSDRNLKVKEKL